MRRLPVVVIAALTGIAAGGALSAASSHDTTSWTSPTSPVAAAPLPSGSGSQEPPGQVVVAWSSGGLDRGFASTIAEFAQVVAITTVRGDGVGLRRSERADGTVIDDPPGDAVIPLDALAIDPQSYARVVPVGAAKTVGLLADDEVLLGETSAALRRLGPGDLLEVDGGALFRVAAVVADDVVAGAEAVFTRDGGVAAGVRTERYALILYQGRRSELDAAIHDAVHAPVRVRGLGETPFLRHGDAVLTQAQIKERFGEFSYQPGSPGTIRLDPAWEAEQLVTTTVPLLGRLRCHRTLIDPLRSAMDELQDDGLAHLVNTASFGGCWNPRLIAPSRGLSRHAWGAAVDLNVAKNPTGVHAAIDDRVVKAMEANGFTWGGRWIVPDPAHFEYRTR